MTVKNISGTPYCTVADIQRPELRKYLEEDSSLGSIAHAGYQMAEYLSTLTIDPETHSGLQDIASMFAMVQTKSLEIRLLSTKLKNALNIKIEEEGNDT